MNLAITVLAHMAFGECGPDPICRRYAMHVAVNRLHDPKHRWGTTLNQVLHWRSQFAWTHDTTRLKRALGQPPAGLERAVLRDCYRLAPRILFGSDRDPTHGATHFVRGRARFTRGMIRVAVINGTAFYKEKSDG